MFFIKEKITSPYVRMVVLFLVAFFLYQLVFAVHLGKEKLATEKAMYDMAAQNMTARNLETKWLDEDPYLSSKEKELQKQFRYRNQAIVAIDRAVKEKRYGDIVTYKIKEQEAANVLLKQEYLTNVEKLQKMGRHFSFPDLIYQNQLILSYLVALNLQQVTEQEAFSVDMVSRFLEDLGYFSRATVDFLGWVVIGVLFSLYIFKLETQHQTVMQAVPKAFHRLITQKIVFTACLSCAVQLVGLTIYYGSYALFFGMGQWHIQIPVNVFAQQEMTLPFWGILGLTLLALFTINLAITALSALIQFITKNQVFALVGMGCLLIAEWLSYQWNISAPASLLNISRLIDIGPILSGFKGQLYPKETFHFDTIIVTMCAIAVSCFMGILCAKFIGKVWSKKYGQFTI